MANCYGFFREGCWHSEKECGLPQETFVLYASQLPQKLVARADAVGAQRLYLVIVKFGDAPQVTQREQPAIAGINEQSTSIQFGLPGHLCLLASEL
ncbi:hypothetical protein QQY66_45665 [Streptomyces sp. DG2A-72]|uniref:hypothetical protein n=1 Tax=Streptomyces sp. DG2A-72 TaxID=3051386 RepID=UPI00265C247C|nr:hypothetical protein [Streptomyces sp. DG2A-72]MDO0938657.1 hypothetical protein [Streptomyces sp. DG2A-72]